MSAAALFLAIASGVHAQTQRPTFYGYSEHDPEGTAGYGGTDQAYIDELDFVQSVHVWMDTAQVFNPATLATAAYNDVHLRMVENNTPTLRPNRICIRIQNLGNGPNRRLYSHPDDAVRDPSGNIYAFAPHAAPWFSHGALELKAWMTTFVTTYASLSSSDPLLRPNRFHLDEEPDTINPYSNFTTQAFLYAVNDPAGRWSTEPVPGFQTAGGLPMTLKDIYTAERVSYGLPVDPNDAVNPALAPKDSDQNRKWYLWWAHVWIQAYEGAMETAVYKPIRAAFPPATGYAGCKVSNYQTSADTDGVYFPPFRDPGGIYYQRGQVIGHGFSPAWVITSAGTSWYVPWWRGRADMYAPELYDFRPLHRNIGPLAPPSGENVWDASIRNHRFNLDAIITSGGGGGGTIEERAARLSPWINLTGMPHNPATSRYTRDEVRDQLAMLRSKAVPEINVFWTLCNFGCGNPPFCYVDCPDQPSRDAVNRAFDDFRMANRQAYDANLLDYTVEHGTVSGSASVKLLHNSLWNPLLTVGQPVSGCLSSQIVGRFAVSSTGVLPAKVNVEVTSDAAAVKVRVFAVRTSGVRDELTPYPLTNTTVPGNGVPGIMSFKVQPDQQYITTSGHVYIVVKQELTANGCTGSVGSFSTKVDLLQLVPIDCPGDLDDGTATGHRDGGVDMNDMYYFLDQYQLGQPAADLDDGSGNGFPDGLINNDDMTYFMNRFGAGC